MNRGIKPKLVRMNPISKIRYPKGRFFVGSPNSEIQVSLKLNGNGKIIPDISKHVEKKPNRKSKYSE